MQNRVLSINKIRFEELTADITFSRTQTEFTHGFHQGFFNGFLEVIQPFCHAIVIREQFLRAIKNTQRANG